MNNPTPDLQSQASPQKEEFPDHSLWRNAPAWRNLVIGAACLTAFTVATPFLSRTNELVREGGKIATEPQTTVEPQSSCPLKPGQIFTGNAGKVVGFLSPEQALDLMQRAEAQLHAKLNPAFLKNPRAVITPDGTQLRLVALVPATVTVNIGDQVVYNGAYKDPGLPCHYMPNLISNVISPAASGGGTAPSKK
jgi:regulator of extracellular matrix RemA (YlzA/DUF370 family)